MAEITNIERFISDMNNDLEGRKRDLPTNPFEKQGELARLFPSVAFNHANSFYFSDVYYPEGSNIDIYNLEVVIKDFTEVRTNYKPSIKAEQTEPAIIANYEDVTNVNVESEMEKSEPVKRKAA